MVNIMYNVIRCCIQYHTSIKHNMKNFIKKLRFDEVETDLTFITLNLIVNEFSGTGKSKLKITNTKAHHWQ